MARGRRAWGARIVATLLLATVLVGPGRQNAPANAEPTPAPPTSVSVSARDTVAVASWAQPEAGNFLVEVSAQPDFVILERTTVARDLVVLDSLSPGTTYYLRVSALSADGVAGTPSYPVSFTTRDAAFPLTAPVLTIDSSSSTSLTPRWVGDGDDLSYQVEVFPEQSPSEVTSRTVDAEEATFGKLKTGTRYSARVRIVDAAGVPRSDWSATLTREPAEYLPLRVATYNIQKWTQHNWSKRRTALVSTIRDQDPDVVGLQEATPARVPGGRRQYADLVHLLGSDWALTEDRGPASGEVRTIYNRTRLDLLDHGQHALTGSTKFGVQRYAAWALFRQQSTGKRFIFVNTHFVYQKSASAYRSRTSAAQQLVQMIERVNTDGLPVVIVGDFNSGALRNSGNGVYRTITGAGYLDPLVGTDRLGTAEKRVRAELKTVNGYRRKAPVDRTAPMIDHVFVSKLRVAEWETVARLDRSGRFIGTIPSDHNMVRATVYLP